MSLCNTLYMWHDFICSCHWLNLSENQTLVSHIRTKRKWETHSFQFSMKSLGEMTCPELLMHTVEKPRIPHFKGNTRKVSLMLGVIRLEDGYLDHMWTAIFIRQHKAYPYHKNPPEHPICHCCKACGGWRTSPHIVNGYPSALSLNIAERFCFK